MCHKLFAALAREQFARPGATNRHPAAFPCSAAPDPPSRGRVRSPGAAAWQAPGGWADGQAPSSRRGTGKSGFYFLQSPVRWGFFFQSHGCLAARTPSGPWMPSGQLLCFRAPCAPQLASLLAPRLASLASPSTTLHAACTPLLTPLIGAAGAAAARRVLGPRRQTRLAPWWALRGSTQPIPERRALFDARSLPI